jgi:hypothetical protein
MQAEYLSDFSVCVTEAEPLYSLALENVPLATFLCNYISACVSSCFSEVFSVCEVFGLDEPQA